jgi:hypothetical protein
MKSLLDNITGYFNQRTKPRDIRSEKVETQSKFIENGEVARRLLSNQDFALMFNLYRFSLLERLEDDKTDLDRVRDSHYVAGVRDFIEFIEQTLYLSKAVSAELDKKS